VKGELSKEGKKKEDCCLETKSAVTTGNLPAYSIKMGNLKGGTKWILNSSKMELPLSKRAMKGKRPWDELTAENIKKVQVEQKARKLNKNGETIRKNQKL